MLRPIRARLFQAAIVGAILFASMPSRAAQGSRDDTSWQRDRNERLGFEIDYPKTWTLHAAEPYGQDVRFEPPANEQRLSGFTVGPFQPIPESWFDDFDLWVQGLKRRMSAGGDVILRDERMKVGGHSARRVSSRQTLAGTAHVAIDIFVGVRKQPSGQVWQFTYAPSKDRRHQRAQDILYDHIVSSFRIL